MDPLTSPGAPRLRRLEEIACDLTELWDVSSVGDGFAWATTVNSVADGTLPHEVPAGVWKACVDGQFVPQPAVAVRGATKAEADRVEAEAKAN